MDKHTALTIATRELIKTHKALTRAVMADPRAEELRHAKLLELNLAIVCLEAMPHE